MIRRPPRSTLDRSSAASDVYKRQGDDLDAGLDQVVPVLDALGVARAHHQHDGGGVGPVSYTHLRAHETVLDLVCRLLLENKKPHVATH